MAARIQAISTDRGRPAVILFDDGTELATAAAVVRSMALEPGSEFDETRASDFAAVQGECARERAFRLLGYRERTAAELRRRLEQDGFPATVSADTVHALEASGLVDDERYASLFVRSRAAAGYGSRRIERELVQNGVEPGLAAEAVSQTLPADGEIARARAALRGRVPNGRAERERAVARLVRRGFEPRIAWEVVAGEPPEELLTAED